MEKITLDLLTEADIKEIDGWKKAYKDNDDFTRIIYYIMGGMSSNIAGLLKDLHDKNPIGQDELNLVLCAKQDGEIVGVIVADMFAKKTPKPELYIHFIFTRPTLQAKGIGKLMLKTFFANLKSYFKTQPKTVFANIDKTNEASQKLFRSFGLVSQDKDTYDSTLRQFKTTYENILQILQSQEKAQ